MRKEPFKLIEIFCYRMVRNDLKVTARLLQVFNPESNIDFIVAIWPR